MLPDGMLKLLTDGRLIFLITLVLMAAAGYQTSILVWKLVPEPVVDTGPVALTKTQREAPKAGLTAAQKTAQIRAANLYGKVQVDAPVQAVVEDAPKSTLNYKVRGIYYSQDEALASVILQKDNRNTRYYRLGDEIDNRIYLHQIQPNHVIISRTGKLEKLVLEKPSLDRAANVASRAPAQLPTSSGAKVLQSYRRRYSNNPMALARRFKAIPVAEDGKNIGYKLKALRGEQLLKKLDLQEDDVFVEINGIGLDKPFQALDALKSLTTAENVSVTILRNGNRETLNFNL